VPLNNPLPVKPRWKEQKELSKSQGAGPKIHNRNDGTAFSGQLSLPTLGDDFLHEKPSLAASLNSPRDSNDTGSATGAPNDDNVNQVRSLVFYACGRMHPHIFFFSFSLPKLRKTRAALQQGMGTTLAQRAREGEQVWLMYRSAENRKKVRLCFCFTGTLFPDTRFVFYRKRRACSTPATTTTSFNYFRGALPCVWPFLPLHVR